MVVNFRRKLFTIRTSNLYTSVAAINVQDGNIISVQGHGPESSVKGSIQCLCFLSSSCLIQSQMDVSESSEND